MRRQQCYSREAQKQRGVERRCGIQGVPSRLVESSVDSSRRDNIIVIKKAPREHEQVSDSE